MTYLFRASFSPVQSFISQARKLQDLYAGSYILSHLSKIMMEYAKESGAEILYPKVEQGRKSYPNLFMARVKANSSDELHSFAEKVEAALRKEWSRIAVKIMAAWELAPNNEFYAQINGLWQFYWSAEEYNSDTDYQKAFVKTLQKMGAAKSARSFNQMSQEAGRKCDLITEYNALFCHSRKGHMNPKSIYELRDILKYNYTPDNDRDIAYNKYIKQNEALSAVAFVKRSFGKADNSFNDSFPDIQTIAGLTRKENKYYALVQFDGDNMGSLYSSEKITSDKLRDFQIALSNMVSISSSNMPKIVNLDNKNGIVIYAGGDDFLGAMNLDNVFESIQKLQADFKKCINLSKYIADYEATFSAGIVIAHIKTPLGEVLRFAHESESKAKSHPGKNAYCPEF